MLFTATHESCGGAVSVLAFSPSGAHLLSLGQDPEGAIRVFSLPSKSKSKSTRRSADERDADEDEDEIKVPRTTLVSVVALGGFADPALAGFGAPTGVVSSPPLPEEQLAEIISMDRRAAIRKTNLIRTSDFDILLQELNALGQAIVNVAARARARIRPRRKSVNLL